jgi:hypothetical protein
MPLDCSCEHLRPPSAIPKHREALRCEQPLDLGALQRELASIGD